ncbi:signal recognition particle receptor beta subunit-domain-containing protein [Scheffersomyces amazonensis]|uniref:signal recognition particle receptor beta subunit-domain-containing protein n=1 Tax=Scheffersomyces amazonensis TaxID=1078765 RepID=UPI00315D8128
MDIVQKILLTLLGGFVIILIVFYLQNNSPKSTLNKSPYNQPTFLILGANNSGKTSVFYKLLDASNNRYEDEPITNTSITPTVSSLEMNVKIIELPFSNTAITKKYQLIDYPGHRKYHQLLYKLITNDITLQKIRGIVYVIDTSSISLGNSETIEGIGKFLYEILSFTERMHNGIDFLFALNKSDLFDSVPLHKVRTMLEAELNKLIANELSSINKTSGIDKQDDENQEDEDNSIRGNQESLREFWLSVIGSSENNFSFDKLEGNMDFISGSVVKNKVEGWENWFDEKAVNN